MHKAYRLVAGSEFAICASGLLALHQRYVANPKRALNLHEFKQKQQGHKQHGFRAKGIAKSKRLQCFSQPTSLIAYRRRNKVKVTIASNLAA